MTHSTISRTRFSRLAFFVAVLACFLAASVTSPIAPSSRAQGISSDGRDFFIGYMPAIVHQGGFTNTHEAIYVLVASYEDNNTFTVSYFASDGTELQGT